MGPRFPYSCHVGNATFTSHDYINRKSTVAQSLSSISLDYVILEFTVFSCVLLGEKQPYHTFIICPSVACPSVALPFLNSEFLLQGVTYIPSFISLLFTLLLFFYSSFIRHV